MKAARESQRWRIFWRSFLAGKRVGARGRGRLIEGGHVGGREAPLVRDGDEVLAQMRIRRALRRKWHAILVRPVQAHLSTGLVVRSADACG